MDSNGVLDAVFDPDNNRLRTTLVVGPAGAPNNTPDQNGAWSNALSGTTLKVVVV
jgi:hypothetical protein